MPPLGITWWCFSLRVQQGFSLEVATYKSNVFPLFLWRAHKTWAYHTYICFFKHTTAKLLVYRLTYTSCSYRFWFHLFCFSYSHGLVMLVLCIMFLLLHTSAYSCFLWHSLVYSIAPCCHILKWGVAFVPFFGLAILGALPLAWTFNV